MRNLGVFVLLSCSLLTYLPHADAYKRSRSPENVPLYWATFPIEFHIQRDGTPDIPKESTYSAIRTSFQTWSKQTCTCLRFLDRGLTASRVRGYDSNKPTENINIVLFQTDSWSHSHAAVAVTSTIFKKKDGQIVAFDMELNNFDYKFSLDGSPLNGQDTMDVQNTVTHEVGHVIGLEHSSERQATMFASGRSGETKKRELHQDDINGICDLYPIDKGCIQKAPQNLTQGCGCHALFSSAGLPVSLALLPFFLLFFHIRRRQRP